MSDVAAATLTAIRHRWHRRTVTVGLGRSGTEGSPDGEVARYYPTADDEEALVTRVYLALVNEARPSRHSAVDSGIPADQVDRALPTLVARNFVRLLPDGALDVPPPDITMSTFAADLDRRARLLRHSVRSVRDIYDAARARPEPDRTEPRLFRELETIEEVAAAAVGALSRAGRTVRLMHAPTPLAERGPIADPLTRSLQSLGRDDLDLRSVFDARIMEIDGVLADLEERAHRGEQVRVLSDLPFTALVVDGDTAIIAFSSVDPSGRGSFLVRSEVIARALDLLVEHFWDHGLTIGEHDPATVDELERRDRAILTLLAAGASDSTVARQVGVSQRTVERRVQRLMERFRSRSRFQLGVEVARRGLL